MFTYKDIENLSTFASGAKVSITSEEAKMLLANGWTKDRNLFTKDDITIKAVIIKEENKADADDNQETEEVDTADADDNQTTDEVDTP